MLSSKKFMGEWVEEQIQSNQKYDAALDCQSNHQSSDQFTFDPMDKNAKKHSNVKL